MRKDWEVKKLGDVCDIFDYLRRPITKSERISGDYPYYGASGVQDYVDSFIFDGRYLLVGEDGAKWGKKEISSYIIEGKSWVNNHVHVLRLNESLIDSFVEYYLNYSDLTKYITGAVVPKLTQRALQSIIIPVPPLQTQHQVVEELNCLTSIIEKQKKQLEELDNLAQSIFYDMFGDPIENEKGWEVKNLDEVCDVRDGTHDSPKYLLYSDYILITSKNIANGKLDFTNANYISKSDFDKINLRSKVDKGDILMAMIGTIGNPIIVNSDNINFCIKNMALIKLTPDSLVHRLYLHSLLSSKSFDELVKRINKGGTQKFIALGTIRKLIIPVPPLPLQEEFASKIEAIEKQKELIKKSIKETEELFNSRMDYYFN